jgi:hypothetical protein
MAKSARHQAAISKTDDVVAAAANHSATSPPNRPEHVADADIACRAYSLFVAQGREHGHDVDNWLQAERELQIDPEC